MAKGSIKTKTGQKYGQHFLFDQEILARICDAAMLQDSDAVLEIGPGLGTLTRQLAQRAGSVTAVEIDRALLERLENNLQGLGNAKVIHADIMKVDLEQLWRDQLGAGEFKMVANLPYYITTPILMMMLESGLPVTSMTVMVQKEVATRLCAQPGSKDCGAITAAVQYRSVARLCFDVPAGAFRPPPKVDSAVVRLDMLAQPRVKVEDEGLLRRVIQCAFAMRRKTLRNNLMATFHLDGERAQRILDRAGLPGDIRGERLDLSQFAQLTDALYAIHEE